MTLIQISLLITFISGFLIITYPIYAVKRGWPIGKYYQMKRELFGH